MKIEKWRAGILSFESNKNYDNPFLDVVVRAVFTAPSGRKIVREAYWDGGKLYRVSFAPTETGEWSYILTCGDDNGLNGLHGTIECVEYAGSLDIYRHGFLKVGGRGSYLAHDDDTPFFWLGDTHWGFISGERWDASNHPAMESMFRGMVDRRAAQKFTVYQTNLRPESWGGKTHYWVDGKEGILPDVAFYRQQVDPRMQYIADAGLVNALGLAWGMSIEGKTDLYKSLARYVVARYGALPVVWTLAGEAAGYDSGRRQALIDGWREVARLIQRLDGYNNLQTAHYTNERPFADYYHGEDWYDFTLNQAGHGDYPIGAKQYREYRARFPDKPFIEGEALYEGVSTLEENGSRIADAAMMRRVAYLSIQLGGCGYTYGAQGIWDTVWDQKDPIDFELFNLGKRTWVDGIDAEGGRQMTFLREFYEKAKFAQLFPCPWCCRAEGPAEETLFGSAAPYVSANSDMSTVVLYFSPCSRGSGAGVKIRYLQNRRYTASWFDPRTGEYTPFADPIQPLGGEWAPPGKPSAEDWLLFLHIKEENQND